MTDQTQAGADASQPTILDAVASHLRRRALHAENEALMLSMAVRDLNAQLQAANARNAELEAEVQQLRYQAAHPNEHVTSTEAANG